MDDTTLYNWWDDPEEDMEPAPPVKVCVRCGKPLDENFSQLGVCALCLRGAKLAVEETDRLS